MSILFLRVGIDRGCGGSLSPRFEDGTFEYVPIPEFSEIAEGRGVTYADLPARCGVSLTSYVRSHRYTHYDPEFETYTYGEPSEPKRSQLLRLKPDDYLVFYAGFQGPGIAPGTCFVIGYFCVNQIHPAPTDSAWPPASLVHLHRNAHFRRKNPEKTLVVVEGDPSGSRLLTLTRPFSDGGQRVLPEIAQIVGFHGSVMRAVGRWVPAAHEERTVGWLLS
ncbi:hypothetical protein [Noviherbaspirillum sp. UKPF54]|uniref:Nmad3 family putative nucleotide modification protein n=1 Tax=Noviherbaspirillum sp. UKPF54 TaxID=2601898 RepID=UPI0011B13D30|nr:hypothetical protein [Noviherbaspirillum sp. UKPF54]QDZ29576.1 hypothetical protein FAY22_17370 [Noviherbaspirillum sp. UKPF54]